MSNTLTCGEIIDPFVNAVAGSLYPPIQIIGGNGSAALSNPKTQLDLDSGIIYAPRDCDLPINRPDGTLRDMDVLVLSTNPAEIAAVNGLAHSVIGSRLKSSVFGLKPYLDMLMQQEGPAFSSAKVFLGDRYVHLAPGNDVRVVQGYKSIYPFAVPISTESLQSFTLQSGTHTLTPTSHPGATILNYLTRSISGLRPKDTKKVEEIVNNMLPRYPDVREWIYDGPGRPTLELARILYTLRSPKGTLKPLHVGTGLQVEAYGIKDLRDLDVFMGHCLPGSTQLAVLKAARIKSRALHIAESQQKVVTWWLKFAEKHVNGIVHNN